MPQGNIFISIFYTISVVLLFYGIFYIRKSRKAENGCKWVVLSLFITGFFIAFSMAVVNLVTIPANLISSGISNILAGGILTFLEKRRKDLKQEYYFDKKNILPVAVIFGFVLIFGMIRFNGLSLDINYDTPDPAIHLRMAETFMQKHTLSGMYYTQLINGFFLETLLPFIHFKNLYRAFILTELFNLFMSGMIFYFVTYEKNSTRSVRVWHILVTLLYIGGYPLTNALFGFTYLGVGVSICLVICCLTRDYLNNDMEEWPIIVMLALSNYAIFECYALFMPVVYMAEFIPVVISQKSRSRIISLKTVEILAVTFLIPIIFGLKYMFFGTFSGDTTVGSAITAEGAIYRDFFSNFVMLGMFFVFEIYSLIREKKLLKSFYGLLSIFTILFMVVILYMGMTGRAASYYYYKLYFLLWAPFFVAAFNGIKRLLEMARGLVFSAAFVWILILAFSISGTEDKIYNRNNLFDPVQKSAIMTDVYSYNYSHIRMRSYMSGYDDLMKYMQDNLDPRETEMVCRFDNFYWVRNMTDHESSVDAVKAYLNGDVDYFKDYLDEKDTKYVIVEYGELNYLYDKGQDYFDGLKKVYETQNGFVAEVE